MLIKKQSKEQQKKHSNPSKTTQFSQNIIHGISQDFLNSSSQTHYS